MCEYCENQEILGLDGADDGICIESSGETSILGSDSWEIEINYCPICGRKLIEVSE